MEASVKNCSKNFETFDAITYAKNALLIKQQGCFIKGALRLRCETDHLRSPFEKQLQRAAFVMCDMILTEMKNIQF